ncbi:MAG: hypothetical protein KAS17_04655, partial [Victivallaceae bacterium]|nr:hypothetical protein [Victivallaceae bacterium]
LLIYAIPALAALLVRVLLLINWWDSPVRWYCSITGLDMQTVLQTGTWLYIKREYIYFIQGSSNCYSIFKQRRGLSRSCCCHSIDWRKYSCATCCLVHAQALGQNFLGINFRRKASSESTQGPQWEITKY